MSDETTIQNEEIVEETVEVEQPVIHTFGRVMHVPDDMLNYLAEYIYPEKVQKEPHELPPGDTIFSIEERFKPNPVPKLDFMQAWFDDNMVDLFMARFTTEVNAATNDAIAQFTAQKRAEAEEIIAAKREQVRGLIARV